MVAMGGLDTLEPCDLLNLLAAFHDCNDRLSEIALCYIIKVVIRRVGPNAVRSARSHSNQTIDQIVNNIFPPKNRDRAKRALVNGGYPVEWLTFGKFS
jgi:hypothetical protein